MAEYVEKHLSMEIASNELYSVVSAVNAIVIVSVDVFHHCVKGAVMLH